MSMSTRIARLMTKYLPGDKVKAIENIFYGTGEEVVEGTTGRVQKVNVHGCTPLVTVAWDDRGNEGQLPHITHACSVESIEHTL